MTYAPFPPTAYYDPILRLTTYYHNALPYYMAPFPLTGYHPPMRENPKSVHLPLVQHRSSMYPNHMYPLTPIIPQYIHLMAQAAPSQPQLYESPPAISNFTSSPKAQASHPVPVNDESLQGWAIPAQVLSWSSARLDEFEATIRPITGSFWQFHSYHTVESVALGQKVNVDESDIIWQVQDFFCAKDRNNSKRIWNRGVKLPNSTKYQRLHLFYCGGRKKQGQLVCEIEYVIYRYNGYSTLYTSGTHHSPSCNPTRRKDLVLSRVFVDATQYMKNSGSKKESYGRYIADHIDKVVTKDEKNARFDKSVW